MSKAKAAICRTISRAITSTRLLRLRRKLSAAKRHFTGKPAQVHYFHQTDDPYSRLLSTALPTLQARYRIEILTHAVPHPDAAAAPELALLQQWSERDAARLAKSFNLSQTDTTDVTCIEATLQQGAALRKKMGHYLGATLYFEGEWYWGIDRLHYLEQRLTEEGLCKQTPAPPPLFLPKAMQFQPLARTSGPRPVIHFYCSLRSPYTYLAAARVRQLAEHYGAELRLRFVLPMVMRGLPVPLAKRLYILRDTKREALRLGFEFGSVVDPVGQGVEDGLALLHAAIAKGQGPAFLESFLAGAFAQGIDAHSAHGLEAMGKRAGLSSTEMASALRDNAWRAVAEANRSDMLARGVWGVPSFRINDRPVLWGQDRLWMLEEDLIATLNEKED
jgi:2-hydroxychromene-2-carboxylate isomerase